MSVQPSLDSLIDRKIFIWQGAWKGGAEAVTFGIAEFLRSHNLTPTLGVFKGEKRNELPYIQTEVPRFFPKRYVAYNNIFAAIWLRKVIRDQDIIVTHTAGAWNRDGQRYFYREPGDLRALMGSLPLKSKIGYFIPYLTARKALKKSNPPIAASKRAESFFQSLGVNTFISTQNFLISNPPPAIQRTHNTSEVFNLVFIGRDDKIKNLTWLERFCNATELRVHLHVIGVQKQNTSRITYHGWISHECVKSLVSEKMHALIVPSLFEASPLVVIDALAQGLPVLISKNAAPLELHDVICEFSNEESLTIQLTTLIQTYDYVAKLRYDESKFVRYNYHPKTVLTREWLQIAKFVLETDQQVQ